MKRLVFVALFLATPVYAQSPIGQVTQALEQLLAIQGNDQTRQTLLNLETLKALQQMQNNPPVPEFPRSSHRSTTCQTNPFNGNVTCETW
jgi:hypothetical protein